MVFGLFTRKSTLDDAPASPLPESKTSDQHARLPTPTPSIASVSRHSPLRIPTVFRSVLGSGASDSTTKDPDLATEHVAEEGNNDHSQAQPPPVTPSVGPDETRALYDLVLTIPPKTLHAYTLAHLRPQPPPPSSNPASHSTLSSHPDNAPRPPSPITVSKLITFFSTLAPPPLLHCVRCHKDFYEIENEEKDKACRVPHDDESALVSRVSGGGYETLWGCCGQTASGDGSEGPPDGWCYEGKHTTDIKRARFRTDSTIHDDKLTSCLRLNCHRIRDRLPRRASPSRNAATFSTRGSNPSPARSQVSVVVPHSSRKRARKSFKEASGSENEVEAESSAGRAAEAKGGKEKVRGGDEDTSMAVDEPNPPPKPKSKVKAKPRPTSRARPPASASMTAPLLADATPAAVAKTKTTPAKPKSTSRMLLSQSHTHLASDSEASTRSRPRTRSHVRDESRPRATSKIARADAVGGARHARKAAQSASEEEAWGETDAHRESEQEERGRDRKKRRIGRN